MDSQFQLFFHNSMHYQAHHFQTILNLLFHFVALRNMLFVVTYNDLTFLIPFSIIFCLYSCYLSMFHAYKPTGISLF